MNDYDAEVVTHTADADADSLLALVQAMLRELRPAGARVPTLGDNLSIDLGIDSLARVELVARIERAFGVRLPERLAGEARTLRDLLDAVIASPRSLSMQDRRAERVAPLPPATQGWPERAATMIEVFRWHLERHPDREHVTVLDEEVPVERFSHASLWQQALEVAAGLSAGGIAPSDRVAIMLPTSADFFRAFLGAMLVGAIPVPLYPPARWADIAEHVRGRAAILANCDAAALVTVRQALPIARLMRSDAPSLRSVTTVIALRQSGARAVEPVDAAPGDTAMLQYTSGSTGDPKGVILSHANLLANIRAMGRAAQVRDGDRFLSWLPLYHDMGLIGAWLATLYHAVPLVVMSPTAFLGRPSRWLWAIHRYRASISAGPNFAYEIAASRISDSELSRLDLSGWRLAFNGAEPVRATTLARFRERFAPYGFDGRALTPVYGLAEAAVGLAFPPFGRGPRIERIDAGVLEREGLARAPESRSQSVQECVSAGVPIPGHEIRVVDASDRELPERTEGHVQFRGPSATSGYYNNPGATRALFRGGWLDTGDVGFFAEGELFVTSRVKDVIKRGGHNLHPYDLEAAAGEVRGVRKGCVAVFGTAPAGASSERVVVLAETQNTDPAAREEIRRKIQELATVHFQGPADEVLLVPPHAVLKTSSGKIRRAACRRLYEQGRLDARPASVRMQIAGLALHAAGAALRRLATAVAELIYALRVWLAFLVVGIAVLAMLTIVPRESARIRGTRTLARALLRIAGVKVRVAGIENVSRTERMVVVANHASYADAMVLYATVPRELHFVAKREFVDQPVLGYVMQRLGTRFVERVDPAQGIEDTRTMETALGHGQAITIFPEGTFSRAPGLAAFRLGAFVVAARTGSIVVPAVLRGTRSLLREGRWLPARSPIDVFFVQGLRANGEDWAAALMLSERVRAAMLPLCGEPDLARNA